MTEQKADKTSAKKAHLWKKGKSGNPKGRPKGIIDSRTKYRQLIEADAPAIVARCIADAKAGCKVSMKVCLDKILPNAKSERIARGVLAQIVPDDIQNLQEVSASVVHAMSKDEITPELGRHAMAVIESHASMLERTELIQRLERIEKALLLNN
jgi:hypothetical protein